jgi:hypothetical protein
MKKSLSIILVAMMAIGLFYACKKNNEQGQTVTTNEQQYSAYEQEVIHKLQSFRSTLKSGVFTGEPKSLDSAKWYIETYFNVVKARTEEPFKLFRKDSIYYSLPINRDGLVEYSNMNAMYNKMVSDLDSLEVVIANPNMIPVFARLELISSNSSAAQYMMVLGMGSYYSGNYAPFYADDDWRWGNYQGHCGSTNDHSSDGGEELRERLNNPWFQYVAGSFIDPMDPITVTYNQYPDVNNQNPDINVDFMIFREERTSGEPCLENEELTFYLNRAHEIIYTFTNQTLPNTTTLFGQRPIGRAFVDMSIWAQHENNWWHHTYYLNYATRITAPLPN